MEHIKKIYVHCTYMQGNILGLPSAIVMCVCVFVCVCVFMCV